MLLENMNIWLFFLEEIKDENVISICIMGLITLEPSALLAYLAVHIHDSSEKQVGKQL